MTIDQYIEDNKELFVDELLNFLRIPSVSTDSDYKLHILEAANFVIKSLKDIGIEKTKLFETEGHPIVYGEKIISKDFPTVLVYGHYDVQPPSPLEFWNNPPFEPIIKDGKIFARGACDDKGQMYLHLKAVQTLLELKRLNCNIKFIFEGEEEISSMNLASFLENHVDMLRSDIAIISDTAIPNNQTPAITTGLRGIAYLEAEVTACNQDLHSGVYGGAAPNAILILAQMLNQLKDKNGRILIPNFYDKVQIPNKNVRQSIAQTPFDEKVFKADLGIEELVHENLYTPLECMTIRPTLDINGIWGGYIDEGAKTVIASKASCKVSMRLVDRQDPEEIADYFIAYFKNIAPKGVKLKFINHEGGQPMVVSTASEAFKAAQKAYTKTFGKKPLNIYGGGSIPVVALLKDILNMDTILMGFGLDSDNIHAPNEHFGIYNYIIGMKTVAHFYDYYAKQV